MDLSQDQRLRVWAALAWPYLGTEPSSKEWAETAADLRASGLPVETLKHLQATVVRPVLRGQAYYGRWLGLAPTLNDPDTAAVEARWATLGMSGRLNPGRRWMWRWWTSEYCERLAQGR